MAYTYLGKSVLQILFYVYVTFDLILWHVTFDLILCICNLLPYSMYMWPLTVFYVYVTFDLITCDLILHTCDLWPILCTCNWPYYMYVWPLTLTYVLVFCSLSCRSEPEELLIGDLAGSRGSLGGSTRRRGEIDTFLDDRSWQSSI